MTDLEAVLARNQKTGQHAGRDDDVSATIDQRLRAGREVGEHARFRRRIASERRAEILRTAAHPGDVRDPAGKPIAIGLFVMPDLEGGIERDQAEPPPELRGRKQRRLPVPTTGIVSAERSSYNPGSWKWPMT